MNYEYANICQLNGKKIGKNRSDIPFNANFGTNFSYNPYFAVKSADLPFIVPICAIYHWKENFMESLKL